MNKQNRKRPKKRLGNRPTLRIKKSSYQPSKAELRESVRLNVTPETLRAATMRDVKLREISD